GGSRWDKAARAAAHDFAAAHDLPTVVSFRRQHLFDHLHPNYAGDLGLGPNPKLRALVEGSDLLLLVGARLSENPSQGFDLLGIPKPKSNLVHIHPGPEELGRIYAPTLAINATPGAFFSAADAIPAQKATGRAESAHADYRSWSETPPETPGSAQMGPIMSHLRVTSPDAIITNGAGNYATWVHRFWRFREWGSQVAPTSGSMGTGLPGAVAAKLRRAEKEVICFAGDGCFQMTSQEFGTAVQYGLPIIVLVIDNSSYGTIRMHQERDYPSRVTATDLMNPDFAAIARAYGAHGETVEHTEEFEGAFARARDSGLPAIIHIKTEVEALTPTLTVSGLRSK
ncbi:MAG: thiamine pyrophosphate-dependent enzyme, partial [Pseudomonadota bacterium]